MTTHALPPAITPDQPVASAGPVSVGERLTTIDVLRGVAILGIPLMNIRDFALGSWAYIRPVGVDGADLASADYAAFLATYVFAQGKFISIFAMLFGAGLVLSAVRYEASGRAGVVQYKRLGVLAAFGLLHMTLLWWGDILFHYAVVGAIVFLFRKVRLWLLPWLAGGAIVLSMFVSAGLGGLTWLGAELSPGAEAAEILAEFDFPHDPDERAVYAGGYLQATQYRLVMAPLAQMQVLVVLGPWTAGMMLLGIYFVRSGMLGGDWSGHAYAWTAAVCLPIGLGGSALLAWWGHAAGWRGLGWFFTTFPLGQMAAAVAAVGITAVVVPSAKSAGAGGLAGVLAKVGRMAFTNYLLQSLLLGLVFYGYGLGLQGRVGYLGQLGVVAGLWVVLIVLSVAWLSVYRMGPMEWLWRRVTHGRARRA